MSQPDPHVPASERLAEITVKAIVLGVLLSMILAGANAYLGLLAGMTVSASVPAAVISMAVLRLFRHSNILENNIVQTAASAGESLAAGVIFTLPALVILGAWGDFNYLETTVIAGLGGLLGVAFTIPLRRALIVETPLRFPEGVATAEVLKVGAEAARGIRQLVVGGIIGAIFGLGAVGLKLWAGAAHWAGRAGGSIVFVGSELKPALVAVGYIVGINIAVLVFLGGAINWFVAIPIVSASRPWPVYEATSRAEDPGAWYAVTVAAPAVEGWSEERIAELQEAIADGSKRGLGRAELVAEMNGQFGLGWTVDPGDETALAGQAAALSDIQKLGTEVPAAAWAGQIWSRRTRYLGVGAMVVGGLWALLRLWRSLLRGMASGFAAYQARRDGSGEPLRRTDRDAPMPWVLGATVLSVVPLYMVFEFATGDAGVSAVMAVLMLIAGFLFAAVASYMAGLVGSSNNPISGVTIATLLTSALLLLALGTDTAMGPAAAILIAGVVCCAAAIGGDNMQDLKAGQLVGATPYKQQIMQTVGVVATAVVIAPLLSLLLNAYGIGDKTPEAPDALPAPQAVLMASVARGVFDQGLPWDMIGGGMAIAVVVIIADLFLERRRSAFRMPVLAVAVGTYLPLELSVPILFGGLVSLAAHRFHVRRISQEAQGELKSSLQEAKATGERNGLLLAAGLITGEAIVGILMAVPIVLAGDKNVLAIVKDPAYEPAAWPGLALLAAVMLVLYRVARGPRGAAPVP